MQDLYLSIGIDIMSLYQIPQNIEKKPIIKIIYQYGINDFRMLLCKNSFWIDRKHPNKNNIAPWPTSPNITPNKNGKVTIEK